MVLMRVLRLKPLGEEGTGQPSLHFIGLTLVPPDGSTMNYSSLELHPPPLVGTLASLSSLSICLSPFLSLPLSPSLSHVRLYSQQPVNTKVNLVATEAT